MPASESTFYNKRLGLPIGLLCFCLIALLASLLWPTLSNQPAHHDLAARLSLALVTLSLVLLLWLVWAARKAYKIDSETAQLQENNSMAAMSRLLDEMAPLASGELNVKATVNDGTPGALAKAFNSVVGELQQLAGSQQRISRTLDETASHSAALATKIAQNCHCQSERIVRASNSLLDLSTTASELSVSITDTTVFAKTVADRADAGSSALRAILLRAQSASQDACLSIGKIQSLQLKSQTIHDELSSLEDVAQRADLLALNVSLGSSLQSGSLDAVQTQPVVGQLSIELADIAKQLARVVFDSRSLAQAMLTDASEAKTSIQGINDFIDEHIVDADLLAYSMADIQQDAQLMQERAAKLALKSIQQSAMVTGLGESMEQINQITQQVLQDVNDNAASRDSIKELSRNLRQKLSDFNLPAGTGKNVASPATSSARRAADRAVANV